MKNISDIKVGNVSSFNTRAVIEWKTPDARFHVWFDTVTLALESNSMPLHLRGKPILFKNSLAENRTQPGYFESRRLDGSIPKNAGVIAYVFSVVKRDGLIAKAQIEEEAKEAARLAKIAEENRQHRIKEAGARLLGHLTACLGYIEMTMAHRGPMSVDQIMKELERVRGTSEVETSHHLGCGQTTRRVKLSEIRDLIAELGVQS